MKHAIGSQEREMIEESRKNNGRFDVCVCVLPKRICQGSCALRFDKHKIKIWLFPSYKPAFSLRFLESDSQRERVRDAESKRRRLSYTCLLFSLSFLVFPMYMYIRDSHCTASLFFAMMKPERRLKEQSLEIKWNN